MQFADTFFQLRLVASDKLPNATISDNVYTNVNVPTSGLVFDFDAAGLLFSSNNESFSSIEVTGIYTISNAREVIFIDTSFTTVSKLAISPASMLYFAAT